MSPQYQVTHRQSAGLSFYSAFALNALCLAPVLWSGYFMDDTYNSQIRGTLTQGNVGLWQFFWRTHLAWLHIQGRNAPLVFSEYPLFYAVRSLVAYKVVMWLMALGGIYAFYSFTRRVFGDGLALASVLAMPLVLQFRTTSDPVIAFAGLLPMLAMALFGALRLLVEYIDSRRSVYLAGSVALVMIGALMYEITYALLPLFIVVAWERRRNWSAALRDTLPHLTAGAALGGIWLYYRSQATGLTPGSTYAAAFSPGAILKCFFSQTAGLFPFASEFFDPYYRKLPAGDAILVFAALLVAIAAAAVWRFGLPKTESARTETLVWIFAAGLIALPTLLISFSPKFHARPFGDTYLQGYLACMGVALLIGALLRRISQKFQLAVIALAAAATGYGFYEHSSVVALLNAYFLDARTVAETGLDQCFRPQLAKSTLVFYDPSYAWVNADLFAEYAGKPVTVHSTAERFSLADAGKYGALCRANGTLHYCDLPAETSVWIFSVQETGRKQAAASLSHVSRIAVSDAGLQGIWIDSGDVVLSSASAFIRPWTPVAFGARGAVDEGDLRFTSGRELQMTQHGADWSAWHFRCPPIEATSLYAGLTQPHPIFTTRSGEALESGKAVKRLLDGGEYLHQTFQQITWPRSVDLGIANPAVPFSIDLLVQPQSRQTPFADMVSNHGTAFTGLAIEQDGTTNNHFDLVVGTGKAYEKAASFVLTPGAQHYISIQIGATDARVFVDGKLAGGKSVVYAPSAQRLLLGNWVINDRGFSGAIPEIAIGKPRSEAAIRAAAAKLPR